MNWQAWASFVVQHFIAGALTSTVTLSATGQNPLSKEGLAVMLGAGLVSAGQHLRQDPRWNAPTQ